MMTMTMMTMTTTMTTMIKRPVGFMMAQVLTVASSSVLFGLAGFLSSQADDQSATSVADSPPSALNLTSVPVVPLDTNPLGAPSSTPTAIVDAPAKTASSTESAPAPAPTPVDGTSTGS